VKWRKTIVATSVVIGIISAGSLWTVFAKQPLKTVTATIAVHYGLILNGEEWIPKDPNKQPIYPLVVGGSTYLPVRALADALDVNIRWDGVSHTIIIGDSPVQSGAEPSAHSDTHSHTESDGQTHTHSHAESDDHSNTTAPDLTKLPLGDGKYTTDGPKKGYIFMAAVHMAGDKGGAVKQGEWINQEDGTFDLTQKAVVDGSVNWDSELVVTRNGDKRVLTGNKLPEHPTGTFPISKSDDAYAYDRNPNRIKEQLYELVLPANPTAASKPSPVNSGAIGVMLTGSVIFNGLDALGRDAVAHETQDGCYGHPEKDGSYHYHNLSACAGDTFTGGHSELVGYALDGFGIYGVYGENGKIMTNSDLDEFHGHSHVVEWDGKQIEMYHYHATYEFPYMIGAFKGSPQSLKMSR
jgi:hypothetical protein